MAFVAVAMFAACEPEDKGGEKFPTPDGKQWVVSGYMPMVYDFELPKRT